MTALVYLSTVEEGGGTSFPALNLTVPAVKGRVAIFTGLTAEGCVAFVLCACIVRV